MSKESQAESNAELDLPESLKAAAQRIGERLKTAGMHEEDARPRIAVVTGSGLSGLADAADVRDSIGFDELPGLSSGDVPGHDSRWIIGRLGETPVHLLRGRRHLYEGIALDQAIHTTRMLALLGVRLVVLTNAAGGLSKKLFPGDLMLIRDQINLMFRNPLVGPNADALGGRFPDMSEPFSPPAQAMIRRAALAEKIKLKEGVYAAVMGPNFETRAEVGMLRRLGADAVGMSTVPEVLAARHAGMLVVGLSLITNSHVNRAGSAAGPTTHEEVLERGIEGAKRLTRLLTRGLPRLARLADAPSNRQ